MTKGLLTALAVMLVCAAIPVAQVLLAPFGPFLGAYFGIRAVAADPDRPLLAAARFGGALAAVSALILTAAALILTYAIGIPGKFVILAWLAVFVFSGYVAVMSTLGGLYRLLKLRAAAPADSTG